MPTKEEQLKKLITFQEDKDKIRNAHFGKKLTDEHKRKLSEAKKGKKRAGNPEKWKHTEDTKRKISESNKGKKRSEKIRKKISEAKKRNGYKHSKETKNKIGAKHKGRKHTLKSRINMSNAHKGIKQSRETIEKRASKFRGENHWKWKKFRNLIIENHRIRGSIEFRLWREAVFARDNWTCQKCKQRGEKLHPHHIRNFAEEKELRFAIDNGITLCKNCHWKFHKKYGTKNNSKNQLSEFLNNE